MISLIDFNPTFNISNEMLTIQSLNSTFKILKRSAVFGVRFSKKKKTIMKRFWSDNWRKLKEKENLILWLSVRLVINLQLWEVICTFLQILTTNLKVKAKSSSLFYYNVKLTEQTIHILHLWIKEYHKKIQDNFCKISQRNTLHS